MGTEYKTDEMTCVKNRNNLTFASDAGEFGFVYGCLYQA